MFRALAGFVLVVLMSVTVTTRAATVTPTRVRSSTVSVPSDSASATLSSSHGPASMTSTLQLVMTQTPTILDTNTHSQQLQSSLTPTYRATITGTLPDGVSATRLAGAASTLSTQLPATPSVVPSMSRTALPAVTSTVTIRATGTLSQIPISPLSAAASTSLQDSYPPTVTVILAVLGGLIVIGGVAVLVRLRAKREARIAKCDAIADIEKPVLHMPATSMAICSV
jgi:hypothetical protein